MQMYFQKIHQLEYIDNYLFQDWQKHKGSWNSNYPILNLYFFNLQYQNSCGQKHWRFRTFPRNYSRPKIGCWKTHGLRLRQTRGWFIGKIFPTFGYAIYLFVFLLHITFFRWFGRQILSTCGYVRIVSSFKDMIAVIL